MRFDITFYPLDSTDRDAIVELLTAATTEFVEADGIISASVSESVVEEVGEAGFAFESRRVLPLRDDETQGAKGIPAGVPGRHEGLLGPMSGAPLPLRGGSSPKDEEEEESDAASGARSLQLDDAMEEAPDAASAAEDAQELFEASKTIELHSSTAGLVPSAIGSPVAHGRSRLEATSSSAAERLSRKLRALGAHVERVEGRWLVVDVQTALVADAIGRANVEVRPYAKMISADDGVAKALGLDPSWSWTGDGEFVGVVDSGCDASHPMFENARLSFETRPNAEAGDLTGHGTHVAATICGRHPGPHGDHGLALGARVHSVGVYSGGEFAVPLDLFGFLEALRDKGARIVNLSWQSTRPMHDYDWQSQEIDRFTATYPDTLVVVAAGNRSRVPLANGQWEVSLTSPGTSRNALCVGASGTGRAPDGREAVDVNTVSSNSGVGPTIGGSVKPDLIAPGYYLRSARSKSADPSRFTSVEENMAWLGGTSQATAVVSASAALVRQKLRVEHLIAAPSAAAVKATLVAAAAPMAPDGPGTGPAVGYPDFASGYGRLNLSRVLPLGRLLVADDPHAMVERSQGAPGRRSYRFEVEDDASWLVVVLAWFDAPRPRLTNDLKLQVKPVGHPRKIGNHEHLWQRNPGSMGNVDSSNNVEVTRWTSPPPGQYQVAVTAAFTEGPQAYALVVASDALKPDSLVLV